MKSILEKYADLLVNYCVSIQKGERVLIKAPIIAEPLVREVYRAAVRAGGHAEVKLSFREQGRIFIEEAREKQLQ